jgi:hypothetical protein
VVHQAILPFFLPNFETQFLTDLPVIPTGNQFFVFSNLKFEFRPVLPVFVVIGHTGGERFLNPYRYFNPCREVGAKQAVNA